jgi:hypothetical protein
MLSPVILGFVSSIFSFNFLVNVQKELKNDQFTLKFDNVCVLHVRNLLWLYQQFSILNDYS